MKRSHMPELVTVTSYEEMLRFFPDAKSVRDLASFADKSGFVPISLLSPLHVVNQCIPLWGQYADFAFGRSALAKNATPLNMSLDAPWTDDHELLIVLQNQLPDVSWIRDDTLTHIDAVRFVMLDELGGTMPVYLVAYSKGRLIGALLETVSNRKMLRRIKQLEKVARKRDVYLHLCEGVSQAKPGVTSSTTLQPAMRLLEGLRHRHKVRWLPTEQGLEIEVRHGNRMGFSLLPPHMKRAARC